MFFWIFLILVLLLADYLYRKEINGKAVNIPGPLYYTPFIGYPKALRVGSMEGIFKEFTKATAQYGKNYAGWIFYEFMLVTFDPKVLDAVLNNTTHIRKPRYYNPLRPWLGDCMLLSSGEKWRQLRKKVFSAVFHFSAYEDFIRVFDEHGSILVDCLKEQCGKVAFDVAPYAAAVSLDVIAEVGMGFKMNAQTSQISEYVRALHGMINVMTLRMSQPILSFDFTFRILAPHLKKKQDEYVKILHNFAEKSIFEGRKALLQKDPASRNPYVAEKTPNKQRYNIIDYLLHTVTNGEPLSDNAIREDIDALIFGGHETLTTVIMFTLYCLSRHPQSQNKVFKEIHEVIGDDLSTPVGLKELNELKYLECVLKETLRLYPPGTIIGRKIEDDIDVGKFTIPAGTTVAIPIKLIQSDPDVYPEPENFIPERFAIEAGLEKQHPYSFMAFSAGPRDCAGRKFALLELKSIISKVIRHFELLPMGEEPSVNWDVLISPKNGVHMGIIPRVYT